MNVYDESGEHNAPTQKIPEDTCPAVLLSNYIMPRYEGDVKVSNYIKSPPKITLCLYLLKSN